MLILSILTSAYALNVRPIVDTAQQFPDDVNFKLPLLGVLPVVSDKGLSKGFKIEKFPLLAIFI